MEVFGGVCVVVGLWASDMCAPISLTSPTPKEGYIREGEGGECPPISLTSPTPKEGYIQSPLERGEGGECPP